MTQLPIQKERLEKIASWRETYGAGHNVMLPAEEAEALARFALAAREQELVAIRDENPSFEIMPGESEYDRLKRQWEWMEKKNHAASIPAAVPDEMTIRDACKFVQDMRIFDDVSVIVMRTWNACRAAMQPNVTLTYEGDNHTEHNLGMVNHIGEDTGTDEVKPVTAATVPAGYVLVPVEPTQEMLTASYLFSHVDNTADSWKAMLAAAPKAPDGWIPVSERMPNCFYYVLVADEHDDFAIASPVDLSTGDKCAFRMNDGCIFFATHWQPIPDMPKVTP